MVGVTTISLIMIRIAKIKGTGVKQIWHLRVEIVIWWTAGSRSWRHCIRDTFKTLHFYSIPCPPRCERRPWQDCPRLWCWRRSWTSCAVSPANTLRVSSLMGALCFASLSLSSPIYILPKNPVCLMCQKCVSKVQLCVKSPVLQQYDLKCASHQVILVRHTGF